MPSWPPFTDKNECLQLGSLETQPKVQIQVQEVLSGEGQ